MLKIGICGYAVDTGIGTMTRAMLRKLPARAFWHVKQEDLGWGAVPQTDARVFQWNGESDGGPILDHFLSMVDVVVATERWWPSAMPALAKAHGKRTVLIVTPEWFDPSPAATADVDLLIAYNGATSYMLAGLGLAARTKQLQYPVELERFPFRRREVAQNFLFINGWTGVQDRSGIKEVEAALAQCPHLLSVCSQRTLTRPFAAARVLPPDDPAAMYACADVVVRPSRHEGIGLVLLEALASGCPVLTTDGIPMAEYVEACFGNGAPLFLLEPETRDMIRTRADTLPWWHYVVRPADIVRKIQALRDQPIADYSMRAGEYIRDAHGQSAWAALRAAIGG